MPGKSKPAKSPAPQSSTDTSRATPYQRMRELLASRAADGGSGGITTVDDLKTHLKKTTSLENVVISMKLLWVSDHEHKSLKFCRLHFVDADSPEPLEQLLETFRDQYADNARDIDALLFTATMWNVQSGDNRLPPPGSVVRVSHCSNLSLFLDEQCQATAKLANLSWT